MQSAAGGTFLPHLEYPIYNRIYGYYKILYIVYCEKMKTLDNIIFKLLCSMGKFRSVNHGFVARESAACGGHVSFGYVFDH